MKIQELIERGWIPDCTSKGCWENPVTGARVWACADEACGMYGKEQKGKVR
jgi:hypothetical protein